jgi:hypothetical protein
MNRNPRARWRRYGIAAVAAAALLGGAVVLLVSSRSSASSSGSTTVSDAQQAALAYARCMRDNGEPNFPDPDANGRFRGLGHEQQGDPTFQAAQQACRNQAPAGSHEQEMGSPAFISQLRVLARCMRANGLPNFPDPGSGGITAEFMGKVEALQADPNWPVALQACRSKLPGGGAHQP